MASGIPFLFVACLTCFVFSTDSTVRLLDGFTPQMIPCPPVPALGRNIHVARSCTSTNLQASRNITRPFPATCVLMAILHSPFFFFLFYHLHISQTSPHQTHRFTPQTSTGKKMHQIYQSDSEQKEPAPNPRPNPFFLSFDLHFPIHLRAHTPDLQGWDPPPHPALPSSQHYTFPWSGYSSRWRL
jgi:hypothetical protein